MPTELSLEEFRVRVAGQVVTGVFCCGGKVYGWDTRGRIDNGSGRRLVWAVDAENVCGADEFRMVVSDPPVGKKKVFNIWWDPVSEELVFDKEA